MDDISSQLSLPFFTQRVTGIDECPNQPCRGLWCNSFLMGQHSPEIRIFQFVFDSLIFYWSKHNAILQYLMVDYILWVGYQEIEDIRSLIDCVPPNNMRAYELCKMMNDPYDENRWFGLVDGCGIHKLTYKFDWKQKTPDGHETFYGHVLGEKNV